MSTSFRGSVFTLLRCGLFTFGVFVCAACGPPKNNCPAGLKGTPAKGTELLKWSSSASGVADYVNAIITNVAIECIAEGLPATEIERRLRAARTSYVIAATATIDQWIFDSKWFERANRFGQLSDEIEFEAVSASGVVLGSGRGRYTVIGGDVHLQPTISGRIENLTGEDVARVASVTARWTYGRK